MWQIPEIISVALAAVALIVALLAVHVGNLKRPEIRLIQMPRTGFPVIIFPRDKGSPPRTGEFLTFVYAFNSGARAGLLLDMDPYPPETPSGAALLPTSLNVSDIGDERFALPATLNQGDIRGLYLRVQLEVNYPPNLTKEDRWIWLLKEFENAREVEMRFWYSSTAGHSLGFRRRGGPIVKNRKLDIQVTLPDLEEP